MIKRSELVSFLDQLFLDYVNIKDYTFNGLQFEGTENITKIGVAVDFSLEVLQECKKQKIEFLFTHHGMIWGSIDRIIGIEKKRIEFLCSHNINVYSSHLPLDIHPTLGNNAIITQILDAEKTRESFFEVGCFATLKNEISYDNFKKLVKEKISKQIIDMPFGKKFIKKIAICSGGATMNIKAILEAHKNAADIVLSGETSSIIYPYAKELNMNILCAGHYATEIFGVRKILETIAKEYKNSAEYFFLDIPTGF